MLTFLSTVLNSYILFVLALFLIKAEPTSPEIFFADFPFMLVAGLQVERFIDRRRQKRAAQNSENLAQQ